MKKNLFVGMALVAATLFSACSNEDDAINNGSPGIENAKSTYATFNFKVENGGSKTRAASEMDNDTFEASNVNDIRLLVFKTGTSTVCEVNTVYQAGDAGWSIDKSATVLLTAGSKRIFVIANAESQPSIKNALVGIRPNTTTLSEFYNTVVDLCGGGSVGDFSIAEITDPTKGMVMSNVADLSSSKTLLPGISEADSRAGISNSFTFPVYRVASKAKLKIQDDATRTLADGSGTLADNLKYGIRNVNKSVHLFQQFSGDDFIFDPTTSIPRAPYFNQFDGLSDVDLANKATYSNFYYSEYEINMPIWITSGVGVYFTENTNATPRIGNSTYAVIEAQYLPNKNFVVTDFVYNSLNKVFTSITNPTTDVTPGDDLYIVRTSAGIGQNLTANIFTDEALAYKAAYYVEVGDDNYVSTTECKNNPATAARVTKYDLGRCYYRLNFGEQVAGNTVYGVKRNNCYLTNITKFAGLGAATEDELTDNPQTPLGSKTHVTATITIEGWRDVSNDYEI